MVKPKQYGPFKEILMRGAGVVVEGANIAVKYIKNRRTGNLLSLRDENDTTVGWKQEMSALSEKIWQNSVRKRGRCTETRERGRRCSDHENADGKHPKKIHQLRGRGGGPRGLGGWKKPARKREVSLKVNGRNPEKRKKGRAKRGRPKDTKKRIIAKRRGDVHFITIIKEPEIQKEEKVRKKKKSCKGEAQVHIADKLQKILLLVGEKESSGNQLLRSEKAKHILMP